MAKKKAPKWLNLLGRMIWVNTWNGDIQVWLGPRGWFKQTIGNIKGTETLGAIIDSAGTKKGAAVRLKAVRLMIRGLKFPKVP